MRNFRKVFASFTLLFFLYCLNTASALTCLARMFNDMPLTAAEFTGPVDRKKTVTLPYLTSPAAIAACLGLMARFYARTVADRAPYLVRDVDFLFTTKYGFFKLQIQAIL